MDNITQVDDEMGINAARSRKGKIQFTLLFPNVALSPGGKSSSNYARTLEHVLTFSFPARPDLDVQGATIFSHKRVQFWFQKGIPERGIDFLYRVTNDNRRKNHHFKCTRWLLLRDDIYGQMQVWENVYHRVATVPLMTRRLKAYTPWICYFHRLMHNIGFNLVVIPTVIAISGLNMAIIVAFESRWEHSRKPIDISYRLSISRDILPRSSPVCAPASCF